jgi:hypothetical protein
MSSKLLTQKIAQIRTIYGSTAKEKRQKDRRSPKASQFEGRGVVRYG